MENKKNNFVYRFLIGIALFCFALGFIGTAFLGAIVRDYEKYEYHLDLKEDSIRVFSENPPADTTIHFDKLEEHIIKIEIKK
jgi:hypothetical protein